MDQQPPLEWIPAGKQHVFDDMVFWAGKADGKSFQDAAAIFDTIVSGPHASAAFPEELAPFVSSTLTRRKQHDFSDVITSPVGRAWAAADPRVVFVENPHSRVVLDPNRAHTQDPEPALREFFARLRRQRAGEPGVAFTGVDAVRAVTFSGEDVIVEPADEQGWLNLAEALKTSAAYGPLAYERSLGEVVEAVLAARPQGSSLTFVALHDTNDRKMQPDGALVVERPAADRLPTLVNFGNLGDARGDGEEGKVSTAGPAMRRVAGAWAQAFGVAGQDFLAPAEFAHMEAISLNRPYKGGYELQDYVAKLRARDTPNLTMFQVEFERAALLGPVAAEAVLTPGSEWPVLDVEHVSAVAQKLRAAGDILRTQ